MSLKKYIKYSRDGVISQFSPYLYPFLTIFYPFFTSFICGTLEMALISIFLFSLYPFPIIRFLCLYLFHPRYCRDGADSQFLFLTYLRNVSLKKYIKYSRDGAINQFSSYLSFFNYFLSFLYEFHLRHSGDGADFNIFILSLSFFYYSLSLSTFISSTILSRWR